MGLVCDSCGAEVQPKDINIEKDIAKCNACGAVFSASEALHQSKAAGPFDPSDCPSGVKFQETSDGFVISASTRSAIAFFLVPFTLVWSGVSLTTLYIGPLLRGEGFGFASFFGLPFLIGSVVLISWCLMTVAGRVEVRAEGYDGRVFTGVGGIGWSKRFSWRDVRSVSERQSSFKFNNNPRNQIALEGQRRIVFGSLLSEERLYHIRKTLEQMLKRLT